MYECGTDDYVQFCALLTLYIQLYRKYAYSYIVLITACTHSFLESFITCYYSSQMRMNCVRVLIHEVQGSAQYRTFDLASIHSESPARNKHMF